MKVLIGITVLLLLSVAGFAQEINRQPKKFGPIDKKAPELKYLGQKPATGLQQFKKPELTLRDKQKTTDASTTNQKKTNYNPTMPVVVPDTAFYFPILAVKPDSTVHYHIQVKKPE